MTALPARPSRNSGRAAASRECPAHRAFVRSHACSVCGQMPGDDRNPIIAAHVRIGTNGGTGIKPSDDWCVSLCDTCHGVQHFVGEETFWERSGLDPLKLARDFAKASLPWRRKLAKDARL